MNAGHVNGWLNQQMVRALRLTVAMAALLTMPALATATGGAPTAKAFSRAGLPVEYLDLRAQDDFSGWDINTPARNDPLKQFNANSLESMAIKGNKDFEDAYVKAGGHNATFNFPPSGNHSWPYWGAQLTALKPDLIATLNR
jgi:hypothetical protein